MLCHIFLLISVSISRFHANDCNIYHFSRKEQWSIKKTDSAHLGQPHTAFKYEVHPPDSSSAHSGMKILQINTWRVYVVAHKNFVRKDIVEKEFARNDRSPTWISKLLADYGSREEVVECVQEQLRLSDCAKHEDRRWTADLRQLPAVQEQGHCHRTWSAWCGNSSIWNEENFMTDCSWHIPCDGGTWPTQAQSACVVSRTGLCKDSWSPWPTEAMCRTARANSPMELSLLSISWVSEELKITFWLYWHSLQIRNMTMLKAQSGLLIMDRGHLHGDLPDYLFGEFYVPGVPDQKSTPTFFIYRTQFNEIMVGPFLLEECWDELFAEAGLKPDRRSVDHPTQAALSRLRFVSGRHLASRHVFRVCWRRLGVFEAQVRIF